VLSVPPLRDRFEDLPILAAHFLRKHGGQAQLSLSPEVLEVMTSYSWPGNVRELENALMHAIALRQGDVIMPESLPPTIAARNSGRITTTIPVTGADGGDELPPLTE